MCVKVYNEAARERLAYPVRDRVTNPGPDVLMLLVEAKQSLI